MWYSRLENMFSNVSKIGLFSALALLAACTVEPLNSSTPNSQLATGIQPASIGSILASTTVKPVTTRSAQQVRNNLLFAMNGGELQSGGQYNVVLDVESKSYNLSIERNSNAPTSAQVAITANYQLVENRSGKTVANGKRRALSSYDRTSQSFANERAERDAQNRAAKELAQQLRLAIAQSLAGL